MLKRALISVYDKAGILPLAEFLVARGVELLSTGGTRRYLLEQGLAVTEVSAVTGFPEMMDGRVKTLHPAVHGGILARRDDPAHLASLAAMGYATIDLVIVNLYPFFEKSGLDIPDEEKVEFIDIGGPTMLRSAAKNFADVIVVCDLGDYEGVRAAMERDGDLSQAERRRLAAKVFNLTSAYDAAVFAFLAEEPAAVAASDGAKDGDGKAPAGDANAAVGNANAAAGKADSAAAKADTAADNADNADSFPLYWTISARLDRRLRYGENPQQGASLYLSLTGRGAFSDYAILQGKELSYNNLRDADSAWKAVSDFGETACVAVKHNNPCGAALGASPLEAFIKARDADPVSIYGGIVAFNRELDAVTAWELTRTFLEVVIAPAFSEDALAALSGKKNLRVLRLSRRPSDLREIASIDGGFLVQDRDDHLLGELSFVTKRRPGEEELAELAFGMRVVAQVKSNAIVVSRDRTAVGIAGGQTNRIWAATQAIERGRGATCLASDAFFPFPDVVEEAHRGGVTAIMQPGGSNRDGESIEACDRLGIAMVFSGIRHFKH